MLQSHELTDLAESQLVQLRPLLANLCDAASKTQGKAGGRGQTRGSGLHLSGLLLRACPLSSSTISTMTTQKPDLLPRARWHNLLPPVSSAAIFMQSTNSFMSPSNLDYLCIHLMITQMHASSRPKIACPNFETLALDPLLHC